MSPTTCRRQHRHGRIQSLKDTHSQLKLWIEGNRGMNKTSESANCEQNRLTGSRRRGPLLVALCFATTLLLPAARASDAILAASATATGQSRTQLSDGRWMMVGGTSEEGVQGTIRLYEGTSEELFPAALHFPRAGHTATVLPNGKVLIVGGTGPDDRLVTSAEIIDPSAGTVEDLSSTELTPRTQHSAMLLTNGMVLITGGRGDDGNAIASAQLWDSRTELTQPTASDLQVARYAHEAALLASGEGLIWQGLGQAGKSLDSGEIFNPATRTFEGPIGASDTRVASVSASKLDPPNVADSIPAVNSLDARLDTILAVRFNKPLPMAQLNASTITLVGPAGSVSGAVVGAERGMLAFFTPTQELAPATTYTLFMAGLTDENGRVLPLTSVRFTTQRIVASAVASPSNRPSASTTTTPKNLQKGDASISDAAVNAKQPNRLAVVPKASQSFQEDLSKTPAGALSEDWIPGPENRHGAWRVLGLANDPPLSIAAAAAVPLPATISQTGISGQVRRLNGLPLPGVTVSIASISAVTDAEGRFILTGVAAGARQLKIDGRNVFVNGRHYTEHYLTATISRGQITTIAAPIYLSRVDPATEVSISSPADHDIVLTHSAIPGLEVRIPKGAILRERDGTVVKTVSITPIPVDRAPYPAPTPFSVYFTLQPGGAYVDGDPSKAIKIIYPNYLGAVAGTQVDFWNYDPTAGGWQVYGHGNVSANGKQIIPDESVGFRQIMSFGFSIGQNNGLPNPGPTPNGCAAADPVDCATGIYSHIVTDLAVNDVIPISITREYRTNDNVSRAFGVGSNLSYGMWLYQNPVWYYQQNLGKVQLIRADGSRIDFYSVTGIGSPWKNNNSPTEFNGAILNINETTLTWDLTLRDGTLLKFAGNSPPNQLVSITDRNGNTVTITNIGQTESTATGPAPITQVTSPNGRYIKFFYDSVNRINQAIDSSGRTVTYAYDTQGRLVSATDATGHAEKYAYDSVTNNMNLVTDRNGNAATKNLYDANARVKQQTLADGAIWKFSYTLDSNGNITQTAVTDPRAYVRQHTFNPSGYPTQTILALGKPEQQAYSIVRDTSNLPLQITDTLGRVTLYGYDAVGDVTSITLLYGTANAVTYNMQYDPLYHQLTSVTDPLLHSTNVALGVNGNMSTLTDPLGNQSQFSYNNQGVLTGITDPLGHSTQLAYSLGADLSTITDALGRQTRYFEDAVGRPELLVDPLGNSNQFAFDADDRLTSVTNAIGGITARAYDKNGNLLTAKDPNSVIQTFTYDTRDRRHTYKDPTGSIATYNYDGLSNLTSFVDRKNQTTSITYDGINRPTLITFQDSSTISITWDGGNRPTMFVDSLNGTISRQYDLLDRLTQEISLQGQVNYQYDTAGRRQTMTVAGQPVINYMFDNASRLTQVAQGATVLGFSYDAAGRRNSITWPNGIVGTYTFDNANQLSGISFMSGATSIGNLGYTYDVGGRRTGVSGTLAGFATPSSAAMAYDGTNRLTSWVGSPMSYDANGNLTGFGSATYTWNARNQLVATSAGSGVFAYDALGRRTKVTVNGTATPYLYDNLNPAAIAGNVALASGNLDELFAQIGSGGTTSYLRDGLNSAVAVTNSSANITGSYDYAPYGTSVGTGTGTTAQQFTGRDNDGATGLYYYRARYYSPQMGRFISEDPIGLGGGTNYYAYVDGNPTSLTDPYGLFDWPLLPQGVVDYSAGLGDTLSFGITNQIRNATGINDVVGKCSDAYTAGEVSGVVVDTLIGGAAGLEAAEANAGRKGYEFSHWIPNRYGGPRSPFNGNYVSQETHYLTDPFRYPQGWQNYGDKLPALLQQLGRIPWVYTGTAAGAAVGGASAAAQSCGCQK